jgi:hypothetical protein
MGRSNRTAALERKIELLWGEQDELAKKIDEAERLVEQLPSMRERLWDIETLVKACEAIIKSDQPNWTRDHLKPSRPQVHKIPVKIGNASKLALQILRQAKEPMRVRDIAIEVLRCEGHQNMDTDTITKVANTVGNNLRKQQKQGLVDNDKGWPARWWIVPPKRSKLSIVTK